MIRFVNARIAEFGSRHVIIAQHSNYLLTQLLSQQQQVQLLIEIKRDITDICIKMRVVCYPYTSFLP